MALAADGRTFHFDIPPQRADEALTALARQADVTVLFQYDMVKDYYANRLRGEYTLPGAVAVLLADTELKGTLNEEGHLIIAIDHGRGEEVMTAEEKRLSSKSERNILAGVVAAVLSIFTSPGATGQEAERDQAEAKPAREIEEVIVTAQKREERLQDVPISLSVLGGEQLDRSTVLGLTEELRRVPGVSIGQFGVINANEGQVTVRGVAAQIPTGTGSSPTAYYLDSVPFGFVQHAFVPNLNVYDLDRVEVLRGPQGTLYGASALNGVVRVLTNDANPDKFEFKARASTSNTEDGDWNYRGDMAVNVPLIDGKLAARAVVGYQDWSGWIDKPNDKNANDTEIGNLRFKLNAQPTEQLSVGFSAWFSRSESGAPALADDKERSASLIDEQQIADFDAYGLKVSYDFPWFSVLSMTSYLDYANSSVLDFAFVLDGPSFEQRLNSTVVAQEVLLTSRHGGPWRWSLGGIYRDAEDDRVDILHGLGLVPGQLSEVFTSESYAVFGELTRLFLDGQWEFTVGLRYFEDDNAVRERSRFTEVPEQPVISDTRFEAITPRVVLTWHPSESTTLYASYSEGFRSGVHQDATVLALTPFSAVKEDRLTNYEVGAKGSLLDGRVNFETALYYIDWEDVQSNIRVPLVVGGEVIDFNVVTNGESASGIGLDFGVTARPVDRLELGATFSWNDLTSDSDVFSGGLPFMGEGDRLDYSPKYTVGASADYVFPLGRNGFEGQFSASVDYTSKVVTRTLRPAEGITLVLPSDDILIARTSLSLSTPHGWTASLFVDNLTNERGVPSFRDPDIPHWQTRLPPRVIGVQLEYRY